MDTIDQHFLQGIDTVILRVSDIEKSKEWYARQLGLKAMHQDEKLKLVVFDTFGPTSLTLWQTDGKIQTNPQTAAYPIFKTADAARAHRELKSRGVNVGALHTDDTATYFTWSDPDGNLLEVCQVHNE